MAGHLGAEYVSLGRYQKTPQPHDTALNGLVETQQLTEAAS
jgi:thiamine monophosphate synthase